MKHFRLLLPLLVLALVLSGCSGEPMPYEYTQGGNTVTVDPVSQTITNGSEVFTYTVEDRGAKKSFEIVFPDGSRYWWTAGNGGGAGGWSDDFDTDRWSYAGFLVDALEQSAPRQKTGNPVVGLLLMGLGAVNFFLPELPFYLKYGWAVENAEPSDAYITWTKIGGVIIAILGLVYAII